jgi:hypothetical protein
MVALPSPEAALRTRRWDAVVLGGAAGPRHRRGARPRGRACCLEEETASRLPPVLREPFLLTGAQSGGILSAVLRELSVPLIDQRRIETDPLAFQVVLPDARVDVAGPAPARG